MNKEILIKYLNNSCSEAELAEFLIWLNSDHSDEILMDVSKSEWLAQSEYPAESEFEKILDKIHHRIDTGNNNNIDFISEDENLKSLTDSDTFNDESLYHILDLMKKCTLIDYKILRREKSDDGTFPTQQIVNIQDK